MLPKPNDQKKKQTICQIFQKILKVLMKFEEMLDVFLNWTNFAQHALLTLATPSGYALNLKAVIKFAEHLGFQNFHLKKDDKNNFISPKKHLPKASIF